MRTHALAGARRGALALVLAGLAGATLLAPAATASAADAVPTGHTLSVTGTGTVHVVPDVADMSVGITVQRDHAHDAADTASAAMARIIDALEAAGVPAADLATAEIALGPVYDWSGDTQRLVGYAATQRVAVTVRDLAAVGGVIDAAVAAGAKDIGGVTLRVGDPDAALAQARVAAMADARSAADTLAGAAGVTVTGIVSIAETGAPAPAPVAWDASYGIAAADGGRTATPVLAGQQDVTVTVAVVYAIP